MHNNEQTQQQHNYHHRFKIKLSVSFFTLMQALKKKNKIKNEIFILQQNSTAAQTTEQDEQSELEDWLKKKQTTHQQLQITN